MVSSIEAELFGSGVCNLNKSLYALKQAPN